MFETVDSKQLLPLTEKGARDLRSRKLLVLDRCGEGRRKQRQYDGDKDGCTGKAEEGHDVSDEVLIRTSNPGG